MSLISVIDLIPVIDLLREEGFVVTIHDRGDKEAKFCLAIKIDDPVDLFYLGRNLSVFPLGAPYYKVIGTGLAYFPAVEIDAELYEYICAADQDAD
jgi:hypothetical protein